VSVRAALAGADPCRVLVDDTRRVLTAGGLAAAGPVLGAPPPARVALAVRSVATAVVALAQLDGAVEQLLLLPAAADAGQVRELAARTGSQVVLTDREDLTGAGGAGPAAVVLAGDGGPRAAPDGGTAPSAVAGVATAWLLTTSGTTGAPKVVAHTLASLTRTTRRDGGDAARWGLLYDWARFAGLQVTLQALLARAPLLAPPGDLPLAERVAHLADRGCTHLSATPSTWRRLLMTPGFERLALRQVTLGGEIADGRLLRALAARFPGARVTHVFASTEAGVAFSVSDGREGFPAAWLAAPPRGIALEVRGDRLFVRNDAVGATYVGEGRRVRHDDGFVDTGDLVVRDGDRYLFRGRDGGAIAVAGDTVHPEEVERVLLDHPGVALARVTGRRSALTGAVVTAQVVPAAPDADGAALRAALLELCRARLPRAAVPATLTLVDDLPTTPAGKVVRGT